MSVKPCYHGTIKETADRNQYGEEYGKSFRCVKCNRQLLKKLVYACTLRYCYYCGAKLRH